MSNKIALSLRIFYILYFSQDQILCFSHYYKLLKLTLYKQILKIKFGLDTAMRLCTHSEIASLKSSQDFRQKYQDPNCKRKNIPYVYDSGKVLLGNCIVSANCTSLLCCSEDHTSVPPFTNLMKALQSKFWTLVCLLPNTSKYILLDFVFVCTYFSL